MAEQELAQSAFRDQARRLGLEVGSTSTDPTSVKLQANVNNGLFRLVSYHGTIVYFQAETATLRHENAYSCYTNILFLVKNGVGRIYVLDDLSAAASCVSIRELNGGVYVEKADASVFDITPVDGKFVGLFINQKFLTCDPNGSLRNSATWCREWEYFVLEPLDTFSFAEIPPQSIKLQNNQSQTKSIPEIGIVAVAYKRYGELSVFVNSIFNQTYDNWRLDIIHDGYDADFLNLMTALIYRSGKEEKVRFFCTKNKFNDYGHSLREIGLLGCNSEYLLITNADNYYVPRTIEFISNHLAEYMSDVVLFNMVHSHECAGYTKNAAYTTFYTKFSRNNIDMGAAVVKTYLAKTVGFHDKTFAGDATYFEDIASVMRGRGLITKINKVLLVHN